MAVVSPVPTLTQRINLRSLHDIGVSGIMASRGEILPGLVPMAQIIEDRIYVAVGKDVKDSRKTLIWALQNSGGKKICVICVLVPAQKIPFSKYLSVLKWDYSSRRYIFCAVTDTVFLQ